MPADVLADASKVPMFQAALTVSVVKAPVLSMTAVSCARGKLPASGVPPEFRAQPVALQFCEPVKFQYTVLAAGKVMPELPPQSPNLVPDKVPTAPATTMSLKSRSAGEADQPAAVMVLGVPTVLDLKKMRCVGVEPEAVRVPVTV